MLGDVNVGDANVCLSIENMPHNTVPPGLFLFYSSKLINFDLFKLIFVPLGFLDKFAPAILCIEPVEVETKLGCESLDYLGLHTSLRMGSL